MFIDSHCHLDLIDPDRNGENLTDLLDSARDNQVDAMLCVSVSLEKFPRMLSLVEPHSHVFASVGVHPAHDLEVEDEPTVKQLVELADNPKIIAIGETGLDYFHCEGDMEWQHERFRRHIEASKITGKPLIIHTRDAKTETIKLMQKENAQDAGGVMHCFVEDWETAKAAMDMGFYISFSGIVTFKNAKDLKEIAKQVPLDRLLIETDSPYLAPAPNRGKTNQPAYVKYVAEYIAQLRDTSTEEIARISSENFYTLFSAATCSDNFQAA